MEESYVQISDATVYVLQTSILPNRKTICFVHGLGESHVCFSEAFSYLQHEYNIVVPDVPGYGRSPTPQNDFSTRTQAKRILEALAKLGVQRFSLVGHSWGGDIGTEMCAVDEGRIEKYANVEGDVHVGNLIMSNQTQEAFAKLSKEDFEKWLYQGGFPDLYGGLPHMAMGWGISAGIRYLASVRLATPEVFGSTAKEIYSLQSTKRNDGWIKWGDIFASLEIPKVYCWGSNSVSQEIIDILEQENIVHKKFEGASHWVMMDKAEEFYGFMRGFI